MIYHPWKTCKICPDFWGDLILFLESSCTSFIDFRIWNLYHNLYQAQKGGFSMAVMDEFKEEREALKRGTPKQKLAYFWYYYKWHVIISVIIIGMLVSFIYQFVNRKDTAFNAVLLNASLLDQMSSEQPDFLTDFAEKEGIDLNTSDITFDTSIRIVEDSMDEVSVTSTQKLMAYVAANELDSMITDFDSFQKYANSSLFYDLRDILTEEQLQALEPYFYYVDREVVLAIEAANDDLNNDYTQ